MRRCITDPDFIEAPGIGVIGLCLGYDFAAEHERGIKYLQRDFDLNLENNLGYEARKVNHVPPGLEYFKNEKNSVLAYSKYFTFQSDEASRKKRLKWLADGELRLDEDMEFVGAWDYESFGINAQSKKAIKIVDKLYESITNKDCVIMLNNNHVPFSNPGLVLMVYSKIPEDVKENARKVDKAAREEYALFRKLEKESGVMELLKNNGKDWHYLGIKRIENGEPVWWLNPYDQDKNNFGYFTTDDLRDWAENRGKIIRSESEQ